MKRRFLMAGAASFLLMALTGCGGAPPSAQESPGTALTEQAKRSAASLGNDAQTRAKFTVITAEALPAELAAWKQVHQLPAASPSARVGDYLYVMVVGGQESIGSSAITVKSATIAEKPVEVTLAAEVTPSATGIEIYSFPRAYVKIPYAASLPAPAVRVRTERGAVATPAPGTGSTDSGSAPSTGGGSGSASSTGGASGSAPSTGGASQPSTGGAVPIRPADLPASLAAWASSTGQVPGGVAQYEGGYLYVMVTGGQRPTGGYSVAIHSVQVEGQTVRVTASLHSPAPDQMVTQALTYPKAYAMVKASGSGQPQVIVTWK